MSKNRIWELIAKKLAGEASLIELDELERLLRSNPETFYPMQTLSDLWHQHPSPRADSPDTWENHLSKMQSMGLIPRPEQPPAYDELFPPVKSRFRNWKWITATMILICASVFFILLHPRDNPVPAGADRHNNVNSEISTRNGSKSKLVLPDGSEVWLNSGSRLTYDKTYGATLREVSLTGEAYFDVVKNAEKPFVIHTRKIDIRVLGTAFNVRSYPTEKNTQTSLIRGSIEVTIHERPAEKIILKPNEKLIIANEDEQPKKVNAPATSANTSQAPTTPLVEVSHLTHLPNDSTIIETSWLENKLIFRSETFEELALDMERWYGVTIHFASENIKKKRFTGIFENETLPQALTALQIIAPFRYSISKQEIIIQDTH